MIENRIFSLPPQNSDTATFKVKYDQKQLQPIPTIDDLQCETSVQSVNKWLDLCLQSPTYCTCIYVGMLSKSMGQILHISAAMHVLFHMENEDPLPEIISESAIEAAIDSVEACCQHRA